MALKKGKKEAKEENFFSSYISDNGPKFLLKTAN